MCCAWPAAGANVRCCCCSRSDAPARAARARAGADGARRAAHRGAGDDRRRARPRGGERAAAQGGRAAACGAKGERRRRRCRRRRVRGAARLDGRAGRCRARGRPALAAPLQPLVRHRDPAAQARAQHRPQHADHQRQQQRHRRQPDAQPAGKVDPSRAPGASTRDSALRARWSRPTTRRTRSSTASPSLRSTYWNAPPCGTTTPHRSSSRSRASPQIRFISRRRSDEKATFC